MSEGSYDLYVTVRGQDDVVVHAQLCIERSGGSVRARSFTLAPSEERELGRWLLGPESVLLLEGTVDPPSADLTFEVVLRFERAGVDS